MQSTKVPMEKATQKQLLDFATINLGLDVNGNPNKQMLTGLIKSSGWSHDHVVVFDAGGESLTPQSVQRSEGYVFEEDGEQFVALLIHTSDKPGGEEQVPVIVNGRRMDLPRGEPIGVPIRYAEALNNAEMLIYEEYKGEGMGGLKEPRAVKSYPFSFHSGRPRDEMIARARKEDAVAHTPFKVPGAQAATA